LEVTKVVAHRRGAEDAKRKFLYKKPLRALRLCGEPNKNDPSILSTDPEDLEGRLSMAEY
jgi:hypothetical protein